MKESKIPRECPRFDTCSVNNCPLDPRYPNLNTVKGDPETKCGCWRAIRERIGAKHPELSLGGLTTREAAGDKLWNAKSEEEKQKFLAVGAKYRRTPRQKKEVENKL